jgi:hypothetical protein
MQARPGAAGLTHDAARDEPGSARVAEAQHRAGERRDAHRQALRPLGVLFVAVVVTASAQTHPAPGLSGAGLAMLVVLAVYAAAVVTAISVGWARRGPAAQAAIERSSELARSGLADARRAVGALRGERLPTVARLTSLVDDFRRDTGGDASLALFRGAQEALTNIARYAPGAVTAVTVTYQADRTVVAIEDHVSAPPAATLTDGGGGHGLTAMRERAARVGGAARAGPTAGGWLVELEVPA